MLSYRQRMQIAAIQRDDQMTKEEKKEAIKKIKRG